MRLKSTVVMIPSFIEQITVELKIQWDGWRDGRCLRENGGGTLTVVC